MTTQEILWEANAALAIVIERYRWRPISELHEDFGSCVGVNIDDPGYLVIVHACDVEPDELVTHFTRFAPLNAEQANNMWADTHCNRLMKL